jgi:hypothetical protein
VTTRVLRSVLEISGVAVACVRIVFLHSQTSVLNFLQQYEGLSEWDHPKSTDDLTSLVLRYLHSEVSSSPFSRDVRLYADSEKPAEVSVSVA